VHDLLGLRQSRDGVQAEKSQKKTFAISLSGACSLCPLSA